MERLLSPVSGDNKPSRVIFNFSPHARIHIHTNATIDPFFEETHMDIQLRFPKLPNWEAQLAVSTWSCTSLPKRSLSAGVGSPG